MLQMTNLKSYWKEGQLNNFRKYVKLKYFLVNHWQLQLNIVFWPDGQTESYFKISEISRLIYVADVNSAVLKKDTVYLNVNISGKQTNKK